MKEFKKMLEDRFGKEEKIGYVDGNEGCELPNGKPGGICTYNADWAISEIGEGRRYGFYTDNNPTVTDREIIGCGGHDFAVFKDRFIVDLWLSHFAGIEEQVIFDMKNPNDQEKIKAYYGSPECWSCYDNANGAFYEAKDVPEAFKIKPYQAPKVEHSGPSL